MEDAPARQTLLQPPPFRIHAVQRHKPALPIARLWLLLAQERHQEYHTYAKDKNPEKHGQRHRNIPLFHPDRPVPRLLPLRKNTPLPKHDDGEGKEEEKFARRLSGSIPIIPLL
jgi:hypothetical protein